MDINKIISIAFEDLAAIFDIDDECIRVEQQRTNSICVTVLSDLSRLRINDAPFVNINTRKPVCDEIRACMLAKAELIDSLMEEDATYPHSVVPIYRSCLNDERLVGDVLGRYFPGEDVSSSRIELYWLSIGIAAADMGVSIEDLTQVVLLHEWAHAFTHWGQDSDECCLAGYFSQLERPGLIEGLAQYWTHYASQFPGMAPEAFKTYAKLMIGQKPQYREHLWWLCRDDLKRLQDVVGDNLYAKFPKNEQLTLNTPTLAPLNTIREDIRNQLLKTRSNEGLRSLTGFNDNLNRCGYIFDQTF